MLDISIGNVKYITSQLCYNYNNCELKGEFVNYVGANFRKTMPEDTHLRNREDIRFGRLQRFSRKRTKALLTHAALNRQPPDGAKLW